MIKNWQYQALDRYGQEVSGLFEGTKEEIKEFLFLQQMAEISVSPSWASIFLNKTRVKSLSSKVLSVLFEDLANMQQTGMTLNQMLMSINDCSKSSSMSTVIEKVMVQISEGISLAESFALTGAFPWIVISTIKSGEQSGALEESFRILAHFFKRKDEISNRLREAMVYPSIVLCLLITVMMYVGLYVIPKLKQFLPTSAKSTGATHVVIWLSVILQKYFLIILLLPGMFLIAILVLIRSDKKIYESIMYHIPIYGLIKKETDLAYYFLNLSILLKNGMPLLTCLTDLNHFNNNIVSQHFFRCKDYLFSGMPLWESLKQNQFFSPVVIFTLRRGEEMAKLPEYCFNLSEYFNKQIEKRMERAVLLIQPALLIIAGIFLIIIAFAFLVPVYGSLNQISTGG